MDKWGFLVYEFNDDSSVNGSGLLSTGLIVLWLIINQSLLVIFFE